ncbi:hypothetical protein AJ85_15645 [Alkalihalobacillus alcalophilus ATCC 27647 = CGMCC 1.3604]|uniref:Lipoprotein n=1 Tax=Alkalihalobacillus alcalophilus ATCC 27647 = CGMCC 1.3604 TaxID=1218173 RepID=A0A094WCY8_ALKAL|nr:hypothetical protein [Alkalihalobacillus alcalophilus]KGA95639.1 hypothetical protein BALCAV_0221155 [Alkalihalobacillus alcalophilus ATCC 27647 = CGMCC 1.3604]MED1563992.1 hypothetical protein [Alkalihalobacillus alcalophilus]THG92213.1 hypothetical protein AJ85_15645 [Alkalihalobacillus alcalophilus ATCC 27647 = CGMCC 1.3604]
MLKKMTTLFVLGIAALTMAACSNDEVAEEQPKDEDNKNHNLEEIIDDPVVELSESDFLISAGVEANNRNAMIKSISVPTGTDVIELKDGGVIANINEGNLKNLRVSFSNESTDISFETAMMSDKRALENAEIGKVAEVIDIELDNYPELEGFQAYFFSGNSEAYHHRLFMDGEGDKRLRVTIDIPKNIELEKGRQVAHAIINSAQYE